ncbi:hypothetical protein, partial [Geobacillus thermoleovorans]|uniref:hypothetical protein n=1 Tax=Geobacillus thermoleovorans TaxID=33941 RepID=UPI001BB27F8E
PIRRSPMRRGNSQLFQRSYCSLLYPAELLGHNQQDTPTFPLSLPLQAYSRKLGASGQLVAISKMTLLVALSC